MIENSAGWLRLRTGRVGVGSAVRRPTVHAGGCFGRPRSHYVAVATLIDDADLSARIGADHLGHAKVSMTQDRYMSRGRVHHQVAELLEQTVSDGTGPDISGE
jgi:hypothetical protein